MTLLSSRLFPSPSVNHRPPAQSTTTRHLPWIKLTRTNDTVRFLCSPAIIKPVIRLDERFVARFVVPENAQDLIHNGGATIGVLGGAYALVFAFDDFTRKNILNQVLLLCFLFLQFILSTWIQFLSGTIRPNSTYFFVELWITKVLFHENHAVESNKIHYLTLHAYMDTISQKNRINPFFLLVLIQFELWVLFIDLFFNGKFCACFENWCDMTGSEQKTGSYIIWFAFSGFLANFQVPHFCVLHKGFIFYI